MIYLIDFENVGSNSLLGLDRLNEKDRVFIFYSQKAEQVSMDILPIVMKSQTDIKFIKSDKCTPQNIDFRIDTFLGYLIGKQSEGFETEYGDIYIVSADKGYESVKDFWATFEGHKRDIFLTGSILESFENQTETDKQAVIEITQNNNVISQRDMIKEVLDANKVPKKNGKTNEVVYRAFENNTKLGNYHFELVNELGRQLGDKCYQLTEELFKGKVMGKKKGV